MVNKADNDALEAQFESQFQKPGDLVERDDDTGAMSIESLCMNCHEQGITRLLLLRVPYFRDIILESFECEHCHLKNNSIKSAGQIQERGTVYTLKVENEQDMQRQVIRSDVSSFKLTTPLGNEIEVPKGTGQLTNVEGMVQLIHETLSSEQELRKDQAPELYTALEPIIASLKNILDRQDAFPFSISLDDLTGNSWIAPSSNDRGNKYTRREYPRTHQQNEELGIAADAEAVNNEDTAFGEPEDLDIVDGQVYTIPAECPGCSREAEVNIKKVNIPYFKEVLLFGTNCGNCGYKSSAIKTGGEVPDKGKRITLQVQNEVDLSRDILKSDTAGLISPELDLDVQPGTLGGRFTTVEGLLVEIRDQLSGAIFDVDDSANAGGDGMEHSDKDKWQRFFNRLNQAINGELKFTITLQDPMASSYVQDLCSPAVDPQIIIEEYTRSAEEEDDLGLTDMKTEGYEQDAEKAKDAPKE
ncbi:Zinc finger protein ZPR1 [Penicillium bovifimosum]|uniref:Zinc finger protein ZPR1 n=1 Tax=Penicillium bovifimosum TaxID=126998 RepID=A0A9W9KTW1_9EURO|nr:Zinc finger protein ZPR1 [Penicillium bovifimosum]KAJ5120771.1 Zinc finger protein ZPR1 [Penicillium bovifimosum]